MGVDTPSDPDGTRAGRGTTLRLRASGQERRVQSRGGYHPDPAHDDRWPVSTPLWCGCHSLERDEFARGASYRLSWWDGTGRGQMAIPFACTRVVVAVSEPSLAVTVLQSNGRLVGGDAVCCVDGRCACRVESFRREHCQA